MTISKVSLKIASELASGERFSLEKFFLKAKPGEIFDFWHYHFFYSYPEFGKQWTNDQCCQYHEVTTHCSKCQENPDRNYAGVGSLYLLMNEDRKALLLCDECANGLKVFGEVPYFVQLRLF